jgi:hypothetical protein
MTPIEAGLMGLPLSVTAFAVAAVTGRALHGARPGLVVGPARCRRPRGQHPAPAGATGYAGWGRMP